MAGVTFTRSYQLSKGETGIEILGEEYDEDSVGNRHLTPVACWSPMGGFELSRREFLADRLYPDEVAILARACCEVWARP
jgi:hypothetical protein